MAKFMNDFPFADLLGLKKKEKLSPEQEAGKALLDVVKKYGKKVSDEKT